MKKLDLWDIKDKSISSLSIGQRQRVLLCRCLCVSDKIIFLDEPTNSLDIKVRKMLYEILEKLNREGLTIVMISHDEEAFKYSNRALILGKENKVIENVLENFEKGEIKFD
ncbi:ATP-binding cassette domain-containing protein [Parvimonas sp. G1604]|uniref:ATP-binding cassette domain-containing protein n=1 Tax=Parvimonas sp. G1604 TaxID=3388845 RepID=UPI003D088A48